MDYDYDAVLPSIEKDDAQTPPTNTGNPSGNFNYQTLAAAAETPLPPSSPARTPRKTPNLQRNGSSPQAPVRSPSRAPSISSPLNPDRRSSTPLLQNKKSASNLKRGETPLRQLSSRQSSYNLVASSPSAAMHQFNGVNAQDAEKKPPLTAASVARDYFQKEILLHDSANCDPKTIMLIHDSCYGHRFSRPRSSKSLLSTIVERPERIHASILGLSTAYIRMGGRHAGGLAPPHPDRDPRAGGAVPFKIHKTSRSVPLNSAAVTHVHGQKWMEELQIMCDSAEAKLALNGKELVRPIGYGKDENGNPLPKLHEGDLYLCSESLNALEGCLGGVCDAVDAVFSTGNTKRAFVCIRPPGHHCSSNYPSGFCWINNVHVGIAHAAINHGLTHAAIIDFDLHHGDGSQMVAWEHNRKAMHLPKNAASHKKTPIGYFSLHDINSYPCEMGDEEKVRNASLCIENAHGQSIWNVHLEPWKTHADFWRLYESKYAVLIDKTRSFLRYHTSRLSNSSSGAKAKAAIFLSAGFDASEWEGEGMQRHKVNVPTDFYAKFTADVVRLAEEEGLGVDGRIISVLEGGYSDRALTSGALSHVCGLAQDTTSANLSEMVQEDGLSAEMRTKLGLLKIDDKASTVGHSQNYSNSRWDTEWWNLQNLEALEALVNPAAHQPGPTKTKEKTAGNYSSPTQASTAKMTAQARQRRSLSGQLERMMSLEPEPVPPPPEVDWATAAYELSRILIPADRQTLSCRFDELNAEATRARREHQSTISLPANSGFPTNGEQRMQLRDRKVKPSPDEEASKPANRRKTIAAVGELPDPNLGQGDGQTNVSNTARPRRRSSGTSSVLSGFQDMQIGNPASRESSVMSEKPRKVTVNKKPRTVAAPRAQPTKARVSPKEASGTAPPVPRVPSTFVPHRKNSLQAGSVASEGITGEMQLSQAKAGSSGKASTVDELDRLSSGMKKMSIKLKLPSPEENAERERKAAEAKVKKPRPKKPTVPKAPKSTTVVINQTPAAIVEPVVERNGDSGLQSTSPSLTSVLANEPPAPFYEGPFPGSDATALGQIPAPAEHSPQLSQSTGRLHDNVSSLLEEPTFHQTEGMGVTVVEIPPIDGPGLHQRLAEQTSQTSHECAGSEYRTSSTAIASSGPGDQGAEMIQRRDTDTHEGFESTKESEVPPQSTPASVRRTKADLPVFTSSSPIPFGKPRTTLMQDASQDGSTQALTPAITNPTLESSANAVPAEADRQFKIGSDVSEASGPSRASEVSIWDVPETPHR
jgi:histone deacetylase HOS3